MRNETPNDSTAIQDTHVVDDDAILRDGTELQELRAAFVRASALRAWPNLSPAQAHGTIARAELELLRVHHAEIARLLSRAAVMLERGAQPPRLRAFQRRAAGTLAEARAAGARVPDVAERVVHAEAGAWPDRSQLARAAFELEPSREHELLCARFQNPREEV
ncbi:MAG: hypothetical protein JNL28_06935 [Planctomycetes bacterium]|nr:hypothetical protein [Planctomycetota bacterium]